MTSNVFNLSVTLFYVKIYIEKKRILSLINEKIIFNII